MKRKLLPLIALLLLFAACKPRFVPPPAEEDEYYEGEYASEESNTPAPIRPSAPKPFELIHTRLDLSLDWDQQFLNGKATLRIRPWARTQDKVSLDAKGFLIHSVQRITPQGPVALRHDYNLLRLSIDLGQVFTPADTLTLEITYTARPRELNKHVPEQEASEPGIYFINPKGESWLPPRQVWTQGESHGASGWFPTFDQPNIRCTQDLLITVADSFTTLSNGLLVHSAKNADGTRTDHWKMAKPHAPYLFMLGVGTWVKTTDTWRGREVSYYTDPEYAPYARLIFGNTPEMLEFFSERLGVEYPWEKYAQLVVHDFVSGAMENTTATIHFDGLQHDARDHVDDSEEDYISHELFHQWFGDLVTCESWANLTLNEGFATYGEYLWTQHKYGQDEADHHLLQDQFAYRFSTAGGPESLIRYRHGTPDEMFDGHSYQKGGLVLHMLRHQLGDDIFFTALRQYLTRHAYTDVEVAELRMAFEEASGEDLMWYFDQWFMRPGHPDLLVTHERGDSAWECRIEQIATEVPYRFPLRFAVNTASERSLHDVWVESMDTTFRFKGTEIANLSIDPEGVLLAEITEHDKSMRAWVTQLDPAGGFFERYRALQALIAEGISGRDGCDALARAAKDPHWSIRMDALNAMAEQEDETCTSRNAAIAFQALKDPHPEVRTSAIDLFELYISRERLDSAATSGLVAALPSLVDDTSYLVSFTAIGLYHSLHPAACADFIDQRLGRATPRTAPTFARVLLLEGRTSGIELARRITQPSQPERGRRNMLEPLENALSVPAVAKEAADILMGVAAGDPEWFIRYAAIRALSGEQKNEAVMAFMKERKEKETNAYVKKAIDEMLEE